MKNNKFVKFAAAGLVAIGLAGGLSACYSDSDTVSENLSTEAEQFRIERKIVFYNAITDKYIAEVTGRCSVDPASGLPGGTLAVTCKIGPNAYSKDYLGKSDNVTWFMLQQETVDVSVYHKEIILKPESIVPDFRLETGTQ